METKSQFLEIPLLPVSELVIESQLYNLMLHLNQNSTKFLKGEVVLHFLATFHKISNREKLQIT